MSGLMLGKHVDGAGKAHFVEVAVDASVRVLLAPDPLAPVPVSVDQGQKVDAAVLGAGGTGQTGWLSQIANYLATRLPSLLSGRIPTVDAAYESVGGKMLVGTARDKFRDGFFTFDDVKNWEVVQTGPGQTLTVNGVSGGSRYLNIATGTTANSETILLSRSSFRFPLKLGVGLTMSQRIVNQEVFVELVSVDANGNVETDATYPTANLNNALNAASIKFDGTTAVNASHFSRGFGISEITSSGSFGTTLATGTAPNFIPAYIYEISADMEEVVFGSRAVDSTAAMTLVSKRTQSLPDPGKEYKIRIRVRNLAVAPASTTDVRVHFVRLLDTTRVTVDMARHMGRGSDVGDSVPVVITQSTTIGLASATNPIGTVGPTAPATPLAINSAASTNGQLVLTGTSGLQALHATNTGATPAFVKLYNKATAPTVGTDVPAMIIPVPAAAGGIPGKVEIGPGFSGYRFSLGLGLAITGAADDTDMTAVAAGQVKVMLSRTV